jgi:site-specific DNA recombinase
MRVAIYARVSTMRQALTQSIDQQLERLVEYVRSRGWLLDEETIFRDDGYSGASLNRPGLDRLRDAARQAAIDCVLVTAPDRLARNFVHQMVLMEEFERHGCQVEFLDRPISHDPHDQLLLQIQGAVAEYERTLIADRMRRGRIAKYRAGTLLPWTATPFGYRVDPERPRDPLGVRLAEEEAAVVEQIFASYELEQASIYGVAVKLQSLGIPTPTGRVRWSVSTVRDILTNPIYSGRVFARKTRARMATNRRSPTQKIGRAKVVCREVGPEDWIFVANIPAVVSQERFDRVQAKLARNQKFARRNNTAQQYLLRGLVSCGSCSLACTGRSVPGYTYYICRAKQGAIHSCRDEKCQAPYIPAAQLDELVWQDLCDAMTHPKSLADALERAWAGNWLPQEMLARRETLRKARTNLEHQMDRLTDVYLGEVMPLAEYERRRHDLERKAQGLTEQERQLQAQVDSRIELTGKVASLEDFCNRIRAGLESATFEQKRLLVELLVDRVVVTIDEVEIRYVVPISSDGEQTRFCHLRLDYLHLPTRTVHILVEFAALDLVLRQARDDEARVGTLGQVLGLGHHAPLPAPALSRPVANLAKDARRPARDLGGDLGTLHREGDLAFQAAIARESEDVLDPVGFAPRHQLLTAEARVGPHKDLDLRPGRADLAYHTLEFLDDPRARVLVRLAQARHEQVATAEEVQRQVAVLAVVAVEEAPLLVAVHRIVRGVGVDDDSPRGRIVRLQHQLDKESVDRTRVGRHLLVLAVALRILRAQLHAVERALACQRLAAVALPPTRGTRRIGLADDGGEQRVAPQFVVVEEVLVAEHEPEDALRDQVLDRVIDALLLAGVAKAGGELRQYAPPRFELAQQQRAPVGCDRPAVELSHECPRSESLKGVVLILTLCPNQKSSSSRCKLWLATHFYHESELFQLP